MSWTQRICHAEHRLDGFEDVALSVFLSGLIVLSFGIFPFVDLSSLAGRLVSLGFTVLFLAGSLIGEIGRGWRRLSLILAMGGATLAWLPATASPGFWWDLYLIHSIVFNLIICGALLRQVFRSGEINGHRLRGAIAVYVLIGFLFALLFVLVENLAPGSFEGLAPHPRDHQIRDAVYFSFVTLTTVGYGDVTPVGEVARNLAVVEALLGQVFLAILIGRLVTLTAPPKA